jgi:hypothetical protein
VFNAPVRPFAAIVFACATLACCAGAAQASSTRELGYPSASPFPQADCPDNCQAVAQVSGMQVVLGSVRNPFRVTKPGYVVAWTIRLGQPNADQVNFFKTTFGTVPEARLSVFKSLKSKNRYKLTNQSIVFKLENYFGSTPTFVLQKPLRMHTNEILGLTVPTWVPAFAHGLDAHQAWRSSHSGSDCTATNPPQGAHQTLKTVKVYGCLYRTARLLFSATFVPDPKPTVKK